MIRINGISAPVEIVHSKRRSLGIEIRPDGHITARAPLGVSDEKVIDFLLSKKQWIGEHLKKVSQNRTESTERFTGEDLRKMAQKALEIIPERVEHYAKLMGVTVNKICIRNQKTRWGSCSSKGNLNFNCLLVLTPPEVIDSVVVHELCHLIHMNHSKAFYDEVHRVFPDYDRCDKWLKENGPALVRKMTG